MLQREIPSQVCTQGMDQILELSGKDANLLTPARQQLFCKAMVCSLRLPKRGWEITPCLKLIKPGPSRKRTPLVHVPIFWMRAPWWVRVVLPCWF